MQTAIHAVQIHGGIGFTWDNDTHLWFKRAKSSEVLLGDASYHRDTRDVAVYRLLNLRLDRRMPGRHRRTAMGAAERR